MGDYFGHWLSMAKGRDPAQLPKIFHVNWFRKDAEGDFLWPGYGENIRVLEWIFKRSSDEISAQETPIGWVPFPSDINLSGLQLKENAIEQLLEVNPELWKKEVEEMRSYFSRFGNHLPSRFSAEIDAIEQRLAH